MHLQRTVWTVICVAALFTFSVAAPAAEEPEAVYAKFHNAGLTSNFDEMRRYGTAAKGVELAAMPAADRQSMFKFLAMILPKTYTVASKTLSPDGNRATMRVTSTQKSGTGGKPDTASGLITLVKEKGLWKVDEADWGAN